MTDELLLNKKKIKNLLQIYFDKQLLFIIINIVRFNFNKTRLYMACKKVYLRTNKKKNVAWVTLPFKYQKKTKTVLYTKLVLYTFAISFLYRYAMPYVQIYTGTSLK